MSNLASQNMSTNLVTVNYNDDLREAYAKMQASGIRHLLVTDDNNEIIGIISDRDFQRAKWPLFKNKDALAEPFFKDGDCVESYMSWPIQSVSADADLSEVINLMVTEKISAVVLTEAEQAVGIVTHEDLLKVLANMVRRPDNVTQRLEAWAYNSPIGRVVTALANAGI